jgi:hypothetical protein
MTNTPEEVLREALATRSDGSVVEPSREALAALEELVAQRDELATRLEGTDEEVVRLRHIADLATRVLAEMGGRRSATPMLTAIAELRAALKER